MTNAEHEALNRRFEGATSVDEAPAEPIHRPGPLRVFIRDENKKLMDTIRRLEERIIALEKLVG
jgi:hypothetical protein